MRALHQILQTSAGTVRRCVVIQLARPQVLRLHTSRPSSRSANEHIVASRTGGDNKPSSAFRSTGEYILTTSARVLRVKKTQSNLALNVTELLCEAITQHGMLKQPRGHNEFAVWSAAIQTGVWFSCMLNRLILGEIRQAVRIGGPRSRLPPYRPRPDVCHRPP